MVQRQRSRCYFCNCASRSEAHYADICLRHQFLISLRLLAVPSVRKMRLSRLWQIVRWWQ